MSEEQKVLLPHFYFSFRGKEYKCFKRKADRSAPYYIRIDRRGQPYKRCLETNVQDQAERKAREIVDLALSDNTEALEKKKLRRPTGAGDGTEGTNRTNVATTLGAIIRAYQSKAVVFLATRTLHINVLSLRMVVREGLEKPAMPDGDVDGLKATVLTGSIVAKFEEARLKAAGADEEARQRAMNTINANVRFARSIFKEKFRRLFVRDCGLTMPPGLEEFLGEELHQPARMVKEAPPQALVEKTFATALKLKATDMDAYIAFLLTACSLRRAECQRLEWDAILWEQKAIRISRQSKSKVIRIVPLPAQVIAELREYQTQREAWTAAALVAAKEDESELAWLAVAARYVLPAASRWRPGMKSHGNHILERVDKLMRVEGWTTLHTVHELRAIYLRLIRAAFGLEVTAEVGGHSDPRVTRTHYTGALDVTGFDVQLPGFGK
jgi:integrase